MKNLLLVIFLGALASGVARECTKHEKAQSPKRMIDPANEADQGVTWRPAKKGLYIVNAHSWPPQYIGNIPGPIRIDTVKISRAKSWQKKKLIDCLYTDRRKACP